jgi:CheY-like chemotaxis protein
MTTSGIYARSSAVTALFVDADADSRLAYESVATSEGFDVELAGDGDEALALANMLLPNIIVLDIRLPGIDGFEVARRLRESDRTSAIPIVLVSGYKSKAVDAAVRESGCEGHLVKPFSARALLRLMDAITVRPRSPMQAIRALAQ